MERLGRRVSSHRAKHPLGAPLAYGSIALPFAGLGLFLLFESATSRELSRGIVMGALGVLVLGVAIVTLSAAAAAWRSRNQVVHLHEGGLLIEEGSASQRARAWSDFAAAGIMVARHNGVEVSRHIDIRFKDGTTGQLTGLRDQNPLFDAIVRHAPPAHYDPAAIAPGHDPAVDSLPAVTALGKRLSSHRHLATKLLIGMSLAGLVALGGPAAALAIYLGRRATTGGAWFGTSMVALFAVASLKYYGERVARIWAQRRDVIHVHEGGLVLARARGVRVVRWNQIRSASRFNLELVLKLEGGGKEILFGLDGHVALFGIIQSRVAAARAPISAVFK